MKTTPKFFLLLAVALSLVSVPVRAQDAVNESMPESRGALIAAVRHTGYRVSCSAPRVLGLCGASQRDHRSLYSTSASRTAPQYNAVQRLAGMIADRMEAGAVGNVKLKFKIILE